MLNEAYDYLIIRKYSKLSCPISVIATVFENPRCILDGTFLFGNQSELFALNVPVLCNDGDRQTK